MTPKEESEVLMREVKTSAEQLLVEHGEFHPFGGLVRRDGGVVITSRVSGEECPAGPDVVHELASSFHERASRGELRAAAIAANVSVSPPGLDATTVDAIRISLDHDGGYAVHVFFPYRIAGDRVAF